LIQVSIGKIQKISSKIYIVDIDVIHDVPISFLRIELKLANQCAKLIRIDLNGRGSKLLDMNAGITPNGKKSIFTFYNKDLSKKPKCLHAIAVKETIAHLVIEIDENCFADEGKFKFRFGTIKAKACNENRTAIPAAQIRSTNSDVTPPPFPRPPTAPRLPPGKKPKSFKPGQGWIEQTHTSADLSTGTTTTETKFAWEVFSTIQEWHGDPWQLVTLDVKGPGGQLTTSVVSMWVYKRKYSAGKPFGVERFTMVARMTAKWVQGQRYEAKIRWFGKRGRLYEQTKSMRCPIDKDDSVTPVKSSDMRARKRHQQARLNPDVPKPQKPSVPDPDGQLPNGYNPQDQYKIR